MDSLRHFPGVLRQHPRTVIFCAATILAVFLGGSASCKTGFDCIDNCNMGDDDNTSYSSSAHQGAADIVFERNIGQVDDRFEFIAQGSRHSIRLAPTQAEFDFPSSRKEPARQIRASIAGARLQVHGQAQQPLGGRVNYLRGNDPKKWLTDIPTFGRVSFPQIYPGIDLVYHGSGGFVENDFIVSPGADPSRIRITFDGADTIRLESDGSVTVAAGRRQLSWKKPSLYQETATGRKKLVEGRYRQDSNQSIGFEVGIYDLNLPLVIDPVITYATYFGTPNTEAAFRVTADASGNAYIVGGSNNQGFPITPSTTYYDSGGQSGDVILAKLNAAGNQMIFTTHIGGGQSNTGGGIALDAAGNIYVTGLTSSSDFPHTTDLTTDAILPNENCFVMKLNPSASQVIYSTLIGGSNFDGCNGIGLDSVGNAYVAGATMSTDFPTVNGVQTSIGGSALNAYNVDAFIAKLSADGTKLLYSTYLGGTNADAALAIATDAAGNAYVTGYTNSSNFPVSNGAVSAVVRRIRRTVRYYVLQRRRLRS